MTVSGESVGRVSSGSTGCALMTPMARGRAFCTGRVRCVRAGVVRPVNCWALAERGSLEAISAVSATRYLSRRNAIISSRPRLSHRSGFHILRYSDAKNRRRIGSNELSPHRTTGKRRAWLRGAPPRSDAPEVKLNAAIPGIVAGRRLAEGDSRPVRPFATAR